MKRLAIFGSIIAFLLIFGLLMPVSVYAIEATPSDVNVDVLVAEGNVSGQVCVQQVDGSTSVTVDVDGGSSDDDTEPSDAGTSDGETPCGDDGGSYFRVSWNS